MHEVSLISAVVDQINIEKVTQSFDRVLGIQFRVGRLSGIDVNCIEFCFSEVTKGTCLEGAQLRIEEQDIQLQCKDCGFMTLTSEASNLICESCKSNNIEILAGKSFEIIDIEVI
jgi:hydrogenase nickel incorporation protein HypA/HybF